MYNIVVKWYKSIKDLEEGRPHTVVDSGFNPCDLSEANTLISKMSKEKCCGMYRINTIVALG